MRRHARQRRERRGGARGPSPRRHDETPGRLSRTQPPRCAKSARTGLPVRANPRRALLPRPHAPSLAPPSLDGDRSRRRPRRRLPPRRGADSPLRWLHRGADRGHDAAAAPADAASRLRGRRHPPGVLPRASRHRRDDGPARHVGGPHDGRHRQRRRRRCRVAGTHRGAARQRQPPLALPDGCATTPAGTGGHRASARRTSPLAARRRHARQLDGSCSTGSSPTSHSARLYGSARSPTSAVGSSPVQTSGFPRCAWGSKAIAASSTSAPTPAHSTRTVTCAAPSKAGSCCISAGTPPGGRPTSTRSCVTSCTLARHRREVRYLRTDGCSDISHFHPARPTRPDPTRPDPPGPAGHPSGRKISRDVR